jgi:4-hydroxyphenylacetate 3-monooxygenase
MLQFTDERGASVELTPEAFTIAGYTGRDRAMVQKHIDELAREGIAPPPEVPMWYEMPTANLTTADTIAVTSPQSCGEVEPILIGVNGRLYLGIGSDHTARDVEREDIATSKRVCPKPLGRTLVRISELDETFDALKLESWIDGEPYQSGSVAQIMPLRLLLAGFRERTLASSFVLSCGTVPLLTHGFRFGSKFSAKISGGPLAAPLTLDYTTTVQERI